MIDKKLFNALHYPAVLQAEAQSCMMLDSLVVIVIVVVQLFTVYARIVIMKPKTVPLYGSILYRSYVYEACC